MPRRMAKVYAAIVAHPRWEEVTYGVRLAFSAAVSGLSWREKENNAWCRALWRRLYLGEYSPKQGITEDYDIF